MNYFSLFSLTENFVIDQTLLDQRYQLLQKITHPDKHASASDQQKRLYMQKNAQVNDGYHVLCDLVSRGEHLLEVRGLELASEQETIGDTAFLMQQMDLRESLASVDSPESCEALLREITEMLADYTDRISLLLQAENDDENKLAAIELNKLKFLQKLETEAKQTQRMYT